MDMKVLQFKNKKLCERLEQRQAMEDELREKIEKLEKRQATDDTTLLIVNRYWSQVSFGLNCWNSISVVSSVYFHSTESKWPLLEQLQWSGYTHWLMYGH